MILEYRLKHYISQCRKNSISALRTNSTRRSFKIDLEDDLQEESTSSNSKEIKSSTMDMHFQRTKTAERTVIPAIALEKPQLLVEDIAAREFSDFINEYKGKTPENSKILRKSPFTIGQLLERVEVLALNSSGQGMCLHGGWIIFVGYVMVGEIIKVRIISNLPDYSLGNLEKMEVPSKSRITPVCKYFTICKSCQFLHIPYETQSKHKENIIRRIFNFLLDPSERDIVPTTAPESLVESSGIFQPIIKSPKSLAYRSKMTPHMEKVAHWQTPEDVAIGFNGHPLYDERSLRESEEKKQYFKSQGLKPRSTDVLLDIDSCPLAVPEINAQYSKLRQAIKSNLDKFSRAGATFIIRRSVDNANVHFENKTSNSAITFTAKAHPNAEVTELVSGYFLKFYASTFFQVNPWMLDQAVAAMRREIVRLGPFKNLLDTYCGAGVFGITLSSLVSTVYGIEVDKRLVESAQDNARFNHLRNAHFIVGNAEALFSHRIFSGPTGVDPSNTVVIVDPPRAGCSEAFINQILVFRPKLILYMSCFPWTQAVDAKMLIDSGHYRLARVQPLDFFPQTSHIENLISLERTF